jgi:hypothetical protein
VSPRPPKHSKGNPGECDHDTSQGRVEIPDAVQVVELIKISAFQSRNDDFGDPSPEENKSNSDGNQPAGQEEEVYLLFHGVCLFGQCVGSGVGLPPNDGTEPRRADDSGQIATSRQTREVPGVGSSDVVRH